MGKVSPAKLVTDEVLRRSAPPLPGEAPVKDIEKHKEVQHD